MLSSTGMGELLCPLVSAQKEAATCCRFCSFPSYTYVLFVCSLSIICSIFTTDQGICKPQAWLLKHRCKWDMVNWPLSPPCRTAGPPVSWVVEHHPGEDGAGGTSSRGNCPSAPLGTAWRGPSVPNRNQLSRSFLCCSQIPASPGVRNALAVC